MYTALEEAFEQPLKIQAVPKQPLSTLRDAVQASSQDFIMWLMHIAILGRLWQFENSGFIFLVSVYVVESSINLLDEDRCASRIVTF